MGTRGLSDKKQNPQTSSSRPPWKRDSRKLNSRLPKRPEKQVRSTRTDNRRPQRLQPLVGQPWPEEIEVKDEEKTRLITEATKNVVIIWLAALFGGLLVVLTMYAMFHGNQNTLDRVLKVDECGLAFIGVWATGKAVLKVLGGWKGI